MYYKHGEGHILAVRNSVVRLDNGEIEKKCYRIGKVNKSPAENTRACLKLETLQTLHTDTEDFSMAPDDKTLLPESRLHSHLGI
jgi:hypothetical protein